MKSQTHYSLQQADMIVNFIRSGIDDGILGHHGGNFVLTGFGSIDCNGRKDRPWLLVLLTSS